MKQPAKIIQNTEHAPLADMAAHTENKAGGQTSDLDARPHYLFVVVPTTSVSLRRCTNGAQLAGGRAAHTAISVHLSVIRV